MSVARPGMASSDVEERRTGRTTRSGRAVANLIDGATHIRADRHGPRP